MEGAHPKLEKANLENERDLQPSDGLGQSSASQSSKTLPSGIPPIALAWTKLQKQLIPFIGWFFPAGNSVPDAIPTTASARVPRASAAQPATGPNPRLRRIASSQLYLKLP